MAVIVLLFTFGTVVAMGLPIVTALFGLVCGLSIITLLSHITEVPTVAPTLATMIGLGVGIDYSLFIVTRHLEQRSDGMDTRESIARSCACSGGAVVFAGCTVMVALLSLAVVNIPLVTSLGFTSALVVAVAVLRGDHAAPGAARRSSATASTGCGSRCRTASPTTTRTAGALGADRRRAPAPGGARRARRSWSPSRCPRSTSTSGRRTTARCRDDRLAQGLRRADGRLRRGHERPVPDQRRPVQAAGEGGSEADRQGHLRRAGPEGQGEQAGRSSRSSSSRRRGCRPIRRRRRSSRSSTSSSTRSPRRRRARRRRRRTRRPIRGCRTCATTSRRRRGVKSVTQPLVNKDGTAAVLNLTPTTAPSDEATADLVTTLRDDVDPEGRRRARTCRPTSAGTTAGYVDLASAISSKLIITIARRGGAELRAAAARVPLDRDPAHGGADEPGVDRRRVRRRQRGVREGLGREPGRARRRGADRLLRAADDVRDPVRALDGLRGVPDDAHQGALARDARQQGVGHPRHRDDGSRDHVGGADHGQRVLRLHPQRRPDGQAVRRRDGRRGRRRRDASCAACSCPP